MRFSHLGVLFLLLLSSASCFSLHLDGVGPYLQRRRHLQHRGTSMTALRRESTAAEESRRALYTLIPLHLF
uniref:Uncharacterized protein n=1 Tax=Steinernema glaseri TaxID=37863 RepID=A0A1I7Y9W0_9BILA